MRCTLGVDILLSMSCIAAAGCLDYLPLDQARPCAAVRGISEVSTAESYTCAIHGIDLLCWGASDKIGIPFDAAAGVTAVRPTSILPELDWESVAVADDHACALTTTNAIYCWGSADDGQLGFPAEAPSYEPQREASGANDWTSVAVAPGRSCATKAGTPELLYCWGDIHRCSMLGEAVPLPVVSSETELPLAVSSVSLSADHACVITTDGAQCWGENGSGQLGNGTTESSNCAVAVNDSPSFLAVSASADRTCATESDSGGRLLCWGAPRFSEGTSTAPMQVDTLDDVVSVSLSPQHLCAVDVNGTIWCQGNNGLGQLGLGHTENAPELTAILPPDAWRSVSAASDHTCAIERSEDALYCWGDNTWGQLGTASSDRALSETPVCIMGDES